MTGPHADDGALLALIDGERGSELDAARSHVAGCGACQSRMEEIARAAKTVHTALSSIPAPSAERLRGRVLRRDVRVLPLWRRPALQAAAGILLVAAVAAAGPVRRWIAQRNSPSQLSSQPAALPERPASPRNARGTTITFAATGPDFTVRLDSVPADGRVVIARTTSERITAGVVAGAGTGGDAMVVSPGELRLVNTSAARASYSLSVPPSVLRVRVVIAGSVAFDGPPPANVIVGRPR